MANVTDIPHDIIFDILPEDQALKLCRALQGCRVYIPKGMVEIREVHQDYATMIKQGFDHAKAIERVMVLNEMSEEKVRRLLKKVV